MLEVGDIYVKTALGMVEYKDIVNLKQVIIANISKEAGSVLIFDTKNDSWRDVLSIENFNRWYSFFRKSEQVFIKGFQVYGKIYAWGDNMLEHIHTNQWSH